MYLFNKLIILINMNLFMIIDKLILIELIGEKYNLNFVL